MKNRTSAYRRHKRWATINRKKAIIHSQHDYWHYEHDGVLDKGKIHCSCPMCRRKSYDIAKRQDVRRAGSMMDSLEDAEYANTRAKRNLKNRVRTKMKWPH